MPEGQKKASAEGRSPPQELEEGPRSGPHLLVSETNDVQIFHCLVKVYKENKVPAAQNFNWSQHPQRREHPGVRIPRRGNEFIMGRAWIHILNYYQYLSSQSCVLIFFVNMDLTQTLKEVHLLFYFLLSCLLSMRKMLIALLFFSQAVFTAILYKF